MFKSWFQWKPLTRNLKPPSICSIPHIDVIVRYSSVFFRKKLTKISTETKEEKENTREKNEDALECRMKLDWQTLMGKVIFRKFIKPYIINCNCEKRNASTTKENGIKNAPLLKMKLVKNLHSLSNRSIQ